MDNKIEKLLNGVEDINFDKKFTTEELIPYLNI